MGSASCLSPTLPLPPPEPNDIRASSTPGYWTVSGVANQANAEIIIRVNNVNGPSTTSDATKHYQVEVQAKLCDAAEIQEIDFGSDEVAFQGFFIEPTTNGFPNNTCTRSGGN
jgi:hypothetical protein